MMQFKYSETTSCSDLGGFIRLKVVACKREKGAVVGVITAHARPWWARSLFCFVERFLIEPMI